MTTIFGLKPTNVDYAVLVADRQSTVMDQAGASHGKFLERKLWKSKDHNFCVGHSGNRDERLQEFMQKLTDGKYDMEAVVKKGYFPELRKLNLTRVGKKIPDLGQLSGLLLATRFNREPRLFTCFPLGAVEERVWTCIGSGDKQITEYMAALKIMSEAKNYLEDRSMNIQDTILVGLEAVRRAQSQDIYSHGLDMMVCSKKTINDHYADLGDDFANKLRRLQEKYKPKQ